VHVGTGIGLVAAAWLLARWVARARPRLAPALLPALLLDMAPMAVGALLLVLATGRPLFAGLIVLALGGGFALADWVMRDTLREPVVFSEAVELPQVFTHPHLYLPFAGPGLVIGGAIGAGLVAIALLIFEPAVSSPRPILTLFCLGLGAAALWAVAREPGLGWLAAALRRLRPSGEPFADAADLGPFAMLIVHCAIARAERAARRAALPAPAITGRAPARARPVILVQCESFFDARRLSPLVPPDTLAAFDACCRSAAMFGRLEVPGWGANTMRAEFAVLSGVPEAALGYDRFNPYYAFARVPLESQVWRLRRAGYRTICLHPFDRSFYRRDRVMPALGFERFLGRDSLGGARAPPYFADPDLARLILDVLDGAGPRTFIFAITMGNHGPWGRGGIAAAAQPGFPFDLAGIPQPNELRRYLDGLRRSDAMLSLLMDGLHRRGEGALLGFYGDHLPSLPQAFRHLGFADRDSDYAIWDSAAPGIADRRARRRDLPAHNLGCALVDRLLGVARGSERQLTPAGARPEHPARSGRGGC